MRATKRVRSMRRTRLAVTEVGDLRALAERVTYVGSSEHKVAPTFAGPPRLRSDASKCDPTLTDQEQITTWLRQAIVEGRLGAPLEGDFPRYVWARIGKTPYEGRLVNREQGHYKGYPLSEQEWRSVSMSANENSGAR